MKRVSLIIFRSFSLKILPYFVMVLTNLVANQFSNFTDIRIVFLEALHKGLFGDGVFVVEGFSSVSLEVVFKTIGSLRFFGGFRFANFLPTVCFGLKLYSFSLFGEEFGPCLFPHLGKF